MSRRRHPSWIHRTLSSIQAAADPNDWPPRNADFVYDWNLPTIEVYRDDDDEEQKHQQKVFTPTFRTARSQLDYDYHPHLVQRRQLLQDAILGRVVGGTSNESGSLKEKEDSKAEESEAPNEASVSPTSLVSKRRPWIVFTAGAMGVGKGYVLMQLQQNNLFPTSQFVKIDPDMLKNELPELAGYLQTDRESAATKLHRESTQMADILFEYAVSQRLDVLVDGSLRNVEYYQELFARLHNNTNYRIAILHVTADDDVIVARAEQRAEKTGRVVPRELLEDSMQQVPKSVSILSELADATHVIANNENKPLQLVSSRVKPRKKENGGDDDVKTENAQSWDDFARQWKDDDDQEDTVAKEESKILDSFSPCIVRMNTVFDCAESHAAANKIWIDAYPNFCARCALACDGQCGVCIHGQHLCACEICNTTQQHATCTLRRK